MVWTLELPLQILCIVCCWKSSDYTQFMQWEFKYYLYIYNGYIYCERWIAIGNFTMERVYNRVVDRAFPTGTRQCNFRQHDTSQVINSTSYFKPVYCVLRLCKQTCKPGTRMNTLNDSYHVCLYYYHVRSEINVIYTQSPRVWYRYKAKAWTACTITVKYS
jgi:hypothetical protein